MKDVLKKINDLEDLIGHTPLIEISFRYNQKNMKIYAKLEYYNLTGSIKDRMVYYVINNLQRKNLLKEKSTIIEATSGNTGISLAAIGAYYKYNIYIYMPDFVSEERVKLMKSFGAKIKLFSKEDGGFKRCIEEAKKTATKLNGILLNQFENKLNPLSHYETTGIEIVNKLSYIDAFVSGIGTGGTLMGVSKKLKENNPKMKIYALEPSTMAIISNGEVTSHKIEGIGDDFIPNIVDLNQIDEIIQINDNDAINMSRKLAKELGLGVGISSGANFLASILIKENIIGNVVTIFPDDNKKYLSTELTNEIDLNKDFVSNYIELIDYEIL